MCANHGNVAVCLSPCLHGNRSARLARGRPLCKNPPRLGEAEEGIHQMELTVADRIRVARRRARLSQTQAAEAIGVHRGTFAHWERGGGHLPNAHNVIQLAKILQVGHDWLMTGRGSMEPEASEKPAVRLGSFARSIDEERWLEAFRRLPPTSRQDWMRRIEVAR